MKKKCLFCNLEDEELVKIEVPEDVAKHLKEEFVLPAYAHTFHPGVSKDAPKKKRKRHDDKDITAMEEVPEAEVRKMFERDKKKRKQGK